MRSPKQGLLILLIEPCEHVGAVRLAPILLVHHMKTGCTVRVNLRDLGFDITLHLRTICILEQLDCLAEDLDRMQIGLSFELYVSSLFHLLQLFLELGIVGLWLCCLGLDFTFLAWACS